MERPKEPPLDEQVKQIRKEVTELAGRLGISPGEALMLLAHRELVIANQQLAQVHEMLDFLYDRLKSLNPER
jgi:hypothetical protein